MSERRRILLDVTARRARLEESVVIVVGEAEFSFDGVELDTGCGYDMLIPASCAPEGLTAQMRPCDPVHTLGGAVEARMAEGTIRLSAGAFARPVEVVVGHLAGRKILLGLPLLRAFDVLLPRRADDPRRPALEYLPFADGG